ncbi:MAG TPA: translation factor GTPase family protein [Streptosporangiaceae bacterium]|nr:translation factor GTPase family protein [Streptosporangiaceae bacterium]
MSTLNLGILAHVDAGKTSLTERLLYAAGVIDEIGSVDKGSTQTDTLALERQRGITIKSAVASFCLGDLPVNLIDTPGHPDFIAEVERVLAVLDGAVLVISAVEGVQAQTRVLMRTLRRLRIPTLIFVNKADRRGADPGRVLGQIAARLSPDIIQMETARALGTSAVDVMPYRAADTEFAARLAELLAEHDEDLLSALVDGAQVPYGRLRRTLAAQARAGLVYPVFLGSAITGAGIGPLTAGIRDLLPSAAGDPGGPVSGTVFKVGRGTAGEKVAYVRMFSGTVRARERLVMRTGTAARVTGIRVFGGGAETRADAVTAGQIAKLWGLNGVRIGDVIGQPPARQDHGHFAPPTLETIVIPDRAAERGRLYAALTQLAEQDPLIDLRYDEDRQEMLVSLYGEVQKEVIQETLAADFGLTAGFSPTTTICIERPIGTGAAAERMDDGLNPFRATVGLRIDPAAAGSGVTFGLEIELGSLTPAFLKAIETTVRDTLRQGLHGWQVTDCAVTLTESGYVPPPPYGWSKWSSSAGDFRNLTPLVLMTALRQARTVVFEPVQGFRLEAPAEALAVLVPALARHGAVSRTQQVQGAACVLAGEIPAGKVDALRRMLPGLTSGEGILESSFDHYAPVQGAPPSRPRFDKNPLSREEYLLRIAQPAAGERAITGGRRAGGH